MNQIIEGAIPIQASEILLTMRSEADWMALFADVPVEDFSELDGTLAEIRSEDTSAAFFNAISSIIEDQEMMERVQVLLDAANVAIRNGHAGCMEEALNSASINHGRRNHQHVPGESDDDDDEDE